MALWDIFSLFLKGQASRSTIGANYYKPTVFDRPSDFLLFLHKKVIVIGLILIFSKKKDTKLRLKSRHFRIKLYAHKLEKGFVYTSPLKLIAANTTSSASIIRFKSKYNYFAGLIFLVYV